MLDFMQVLIKLLLKLFCGSVMNLINTRESNVTICKSLKYMPMCYLDYRLFIRLLCFAVFPAGNRARVCVRVCWYVLPV